MTYRIDDQYLGYPPIENVVPVPASPPFGLPISAGSIVPAEDPVWGPGEFVFARAGGAIRLYGACILTEVWDATNKVYTYNMTEVTNTALLGRAAYVYQGNVALTTGQYGWFMTSGRTPVNCTATVAAASPVGIVAAGQLGALAAGKSVNGSTSVTPATQTVVQAGSGFSGDTVIRMSNTAGFFPGVFISGTGVGASSVVSFVDPLGRFIVSSVANSANVSGNVTATYNNGTIFYNVIDMNRSQYQGPIT
jgi:hypothetical protein